MSVLFDSWKIEDALVQLLKAGTRVLKVYADKIESETLKSVDNKGELQ